MAKLGGRIRVQHDGVFRVDNFPSVGIIERNCEVIIWKLWAIPKAIDIGSFEDIGYRKPVLGSEKGLGIKEVGRFRFAGPSVRSDAGDVNCGRGAHVVEQARLAQLGQRLLIRLWLVKDAASPRWMHR